MEAKNNYQLSTINCQLLIVEDHKVVAEGFERLITDSGAAQVIGKAYSAAECFELLAKTQPNILLLDVSLPDGNGIDMCRSIKQQYPEIKILMLTSHSEKSIVMRALENGASGYILKNAMAEEIIAGIQTVAAGKQFLCDEVAVLMKKRDNHVIRLSRREEELLRLIIAGKCNNEIADTMCLGYETIRSYRKNIMLKLGVHNTAQLVKTAQELEIV
jgi:DNA-binding NarL/FixJ family response regulator